MRTIVLQPRKAGTKIKITVAATEIRIKYPWNMENPMIATLQWYVTGIATLIAEDHVTMRGYIKTDSIFNPPYSWYVCLTNSTQSFYRSFNIDNGIVVERFKPNV